MHITGDIIIIFLSELWEWPVLYFCWLWWLFWSVKFLINTIVWWWLTNLSHFSWFCNPLWEWPVSYLSRVWGCTASWESLLDSENLVQWVQVTLSSLSSSPNWTFAWLYCGNGQFLTSALFGGVLLLGKLSAYSFIGSSLLLIWAMLPGAGQFATSAVTGAELLLGNYGIGLV